MTFKSNVVAVGLCVAVLAGCGGSNGYQAAAGDTVQSAAQKTMGSKSFVVDITVGNSETQKITYVAPNSISLIDIVNGKQSEIRGVNGKEYVSDPNNASQFSYVDNSDVQQVITKALRIPNSLLSAKAKPIASGGYPFKAEVDNKAITGVAHLDSGRLSELDVTSGGVSSKYTFSSYDAATPVVQPDASQIEASSNQPSLPACNSDGPPVGADMCASFGS